MKTLVPAALVSLLATSSLSAAPDADLEDLRRRCAEQERQIRQLEIDNQRLQSLLNDRKPSSPAAAPKPEPKAEPAPESTVYAVREGDTLGRIARNHGTTVGTLVKLNGLTEAGLIRPGQKLRLPGATSPVPASANASAVHVVKAGDTFYSIARSHKLSPDLLTAANPGVDPRSLRIGQKIRLGTSSGTVARSETPATTATSTVETPVAEPSPEEPPSGLVSNKPVVRSIRIQEEITFGAFAAEHGMATAKLNALNGLDLKENTLLAKGSELYVSAQP